MEPTKLGMKLLTRSQERVALRFAVSTNRRGEMGYAARREAEAERTRFAITTSFAALYGPRTQPAGPDVAIEGSFRPLPPFAEDGEWGPLPDVGRRAYARRPPHRKRWGPGVLREARTADGQLRRVARR